eukprot:6550194-Heterocapsa_arctica.AAC.1
MGPAKAFNTSRLRNADTGAAFGAYIDARLDSRSSWEEVTHVIKDASETLLGRKPRMGADAIPFEME